MANPFGRPPPAIGGGYHEAMTNPTAKPAEQATSRPQSCGKRLALRRSTPPTTMPRPVAARPEIGEQQVEGVAGKDECDFFNRAIAAIGTAARPDGGHANCLEPRTCQIGPRAGERPIRHRPVRRDCEHRHPIPSVDGGSPSVRNARTG